MTLLDENTKKQVKERLQEMERSVKILLFTGTPCELCNEVNGLVNELAELSDKIDVEKYTENDRVMVEKYGVDKYPCIILTNGKERGIIRFYGIPSGYEFSTLLSDIIDLSNDSPSIPEELIEEIKRIDKKVHIQVFVTPTCPYCPKAVKTAHSIAMLNPNVEADMVEVHEFRELGQKYNVMGVPKTVINDQISLEGAYPPEIVIKKIIEEA